MTLPFGRSVRILLVGDSMAGSLGVGMSTVAAHYGAQVVNEGSPGCSVAEGEPGPGAVVHGPTRDTVRGEGPRASVRRLPLAGPAEFDPDVVVYLARADTLDTQLDGSWQHVGERPFDRWAESRFDQAIAVLGSGGAHVVLLTSPFYDSGEQGDGQPWPENAPVRVTDDNTLLKKARAAGSGLDQRDRSRRAGVAVGPVRHPGGRGAPSDAPTASTSRLPAASGWAST